MMAKIAPAKETQILRFEIGKKYAVRDYGIDAEWFVPVRRTESTIWMLAYTKYKYSQPPKVVQIDKYGHEPIDKSDLKPFSRKIGIQNGIEYTCPFGSYYSGQPVVFANHTLGEIRKTQGKR